MRDFIEKMKTMKIVLDEFINHLESTEDNK